MRWIILAVLLLPACKKEETTCRRDSCVGARYFNGRLQCVEWRRWSEPCTVYKAWFKD